MLFTRIEVPDDGALGDTSVDRRGVPARRSATGSKVSISVDVGKTLALVLVAALVLVISAFLYVNQVDAASQFFFLGEGILTSGLGIVLGEHNGANEAARKLV